MYTTFFVTSIHDIAWCIPLFMRWSIYHIFVKEYIQHFCDGIFTPSSTMEFTILSTLGIYLYHIFLMGVYTTFFPWSMCHVLRWTIYTRFFQRVYTTFFQRVYITFFSRLYGMVWRSIYYKKRVYNTLF